MVYVRLVKAFYVDGPFQEYAGIRVEVVRGQRGPFFAVAWGIDLYHLTPSFPLAGGPDGESDEEVKSRLVSRGHGAGQSVMEALSRLLNMLGGSGTQLIPDGERDMARAQKSQKSRVNIHEVVGVAEFGPIRSPDGDDYRFRVEVLRPWRRARARCFSRVWRIEHYRLTPVGGASRDEMIAVRDLNEAWNVEAPTAEAVLRRVRKRIEGMFSSLLEGG